MFTPLISPHTWGTNMANVCFVGLEKGCSLRHLFVDGYRNKFALLFNWKDGCFLKIKIHLGKLWTCLGEISSIKTVLKTHREPQNLVTMHKLLLKSSALYDFCYNVKWIVKMNWRGHLCIFIIHWYISTVSTLLRASSRFFLNGCERTLRYLRVVEQVTTEL